MLQVDRIDPSPIIEREGNVIFNAGDRGGRIFLGKAKILLLHSKSSIEFDTPFQDCEIFYAPSLIYIALN